MAEATTRDAQLVVIGGGPGGYAAAFQAADLGLDVTLVSADARLGGVCLLRGCIPSKSLLHVARLVHEANAAKSWGIRFGKPKIDLEALRKWKQGIVDKLTAGLGELCRHRGVKVLTASAKFLDPDTLALEWPEGPAENPEQPSRLRFEHAIVATGSLPALPKALDVGDPRVMDSTAALELGEIPRSLLVVGGGYIGLEMGTVYAALGSEVTVVELTAGLLPGVDRDLVRPLHQELEKQFAAIHLETMVEGLRPETDGIVAVLGGKDAPGEARFDRLLVSVGRRPRSDGLGLENTRVDVDKRGFIQVDERLRTADPHILAIGDVAGEPMLAHKATREGKVAAEVVAGKPAVFDNVAIPAVVFTDPEVAWCGLTETEARAAGRDVSVARFPWGASGRALTLSRPEGLTKLLFDPKSERLLGVGLVGAGAGELIAEGALAVEMAAVARDVADTIHAHPTLSETVGEAAEAFLGQATHLWRPKR